MKITKKFLKKMIEEEVRVCLGEGARASFEIGGVDFSGVSHAATQIGNTARKEIEHVNTNGADEKTILALKNILQDVTLLYGELRKIQSAAGAQ